MAEGSTILRSRKRHPGARRPNPCQVKTLRVYVTVDSIRTTRLGLRSSEEFTNEYIDSIQKSQLARFRKTCRGTDVLLIDDVQFLAGKERIQEEFFHTFNALHDGR